MTIGQTIKQLLEERRRVIFPGLGNLEVKESGGGIPSSGKTIDPPGPIIKFDSNYSKDDGVLANAFAGYADLEKEEAAQQVLELVDAIRFALDKGEVYHLGHAGIFSRDEDGKIHFRPEASWVIEPDQYGLDSMDLLELEDLPLDELTEVEEEGSETGELSEKDTVERSAIEFEGGPEQETAKKTDTVSVEKAPSEPVHIPTPRRPPVHAKSAPYGHDETYKRSRLWRIIWIVTGILIVILVVVILIPSNDGGLFGKKKVRPPVQTSQPQIQPGLNEQSAPDEPGAEAEDLSEPEQEEPVVVEQDLFFIIAGSFRHLAYASELQDKLVAAGYPAEVMITENRMYRVCVGSYADKDEAESKLLSLKSRPGMESCWLLSNE